MPCTQTIAPVAHNHSCSEGNTQLVQLTQSCGARLFDDLMLQLHTLDKGSSPHFNMDHLKWSRRRYLSLPTCSIIYLDSESTFFHNLSTVRTLWPKRPIAVLYISIFMVAFFQYLRCFCFLSNVANTALITNYVTTLEIMLVCILDSINCSVGNAGWNSISVIFW